MGYFLLVPALAVGVLVTSETVPAHGYLTGNSLYKYCTTQDVAHQMGCAGYVEGVVDSLEILRAEAGKLPCLPKNVVGQQAIDVVAAFMRDHPATRDHDAAGLVKSAINEAWRCD